MFVPVKSCESVSSPFVQGFDKCPCVCTSGIGDARIDLCTCRCALQALNVLRQAGYAHTDLRWETIILQHAAAGKWVLIERESAASSTPALSHQTVKPFTYTISCVPIYVTKWVHAAK